MADARRVVNAWLRSTLTGDSTLMALGSPALSSGTRVYRLRIPQDAALPALVYQQQGPLIALRTVGTTVIWLDGLYVIKFVWTPDTAVSVVQSVMDRVEALLDAKRAAVSGGEIFACVKDRELEEYDEIDYGGDIFNHTPVQYRVKARAT